MIRCISLQEQLNSISKHEERICLVGFVWSHLKVLFELHVLESIKQRKIDMQSETKKFIWNPINSNQLK